jgi:excisionase family DNA binding protein
MDGYISVNEAARRLGRSIEQVRRYLREGRLAGQRIGGHWFIEEQALMEWTVRRPGPGKARIGEAVAIYEARTMRTGKVKDREAVIREEWLRGVDEIADEIRREVGDLKLDVVEALRRSREEH